MLGRSVRGCLGMKTTEAKEGEITKWPKVSCEGDGYIHDLRGQLSVHSHTSWILNLQIHNVPYGWPDRSCGMNPNVRLQPRWLTTLPLPSRNPLQTSAHTTAWQQSAPHRGPAWNPGTTLFALHCAVLQTPSILWEAEFPHQAMRITMEPTSGWLWELCSSIPCP